MLLTTRPFELHMIKQKLVYSYTHSWKYSMLMSIILYQCQIASFISFIVQPKKPTELFGNKKSFRFNRDSLLC